ncbi:MAG: TetR/AcrR family transcriptional regulator [Myxococcota bacterium]
MPTPPRRTSSRRRSAPAAPAPERILSAALAAFAARGFDGASTRAIAAAAGVPQGLISYHYASKQALWEAAADWVFGEVARDFASVADTLRDVSPAERWRAISKRFVRFAARHPELQRFMTQEGAQDGPRLRWLVERHVRPLHDRSVALIREAAPGVDASRLHYLLIGAMTHASAVAAEVERVAGRDPRAAAEVEAHASLVVDLLIDGALAQSAAAPPAAPTRRKPARRRR